MSCPFCDVFTHYRQQLGRRLDTDTFAMSEENAHLLIDMAAQIRNVTQATLPLVGNEAVPTMLCDLLDGLAEGLLEGLRDKCGLPARQQGRAAASPAGQAPRPHERKASAVARG